MKAELLAAAITGAFAIGILTGMAVAPHAPSARTVVVPPQPGCRPALTIPVDFDVAILQSGPGIVAPDWRYYKAGAQ